MQSKGSWILKLAVWSMVGMFTAAEVVLARDAVVTQYGVDGTLISLAGACVILPMLWWAIYMGLYFSGRGPNKVEITSSYLSFTRANGKLKRIPWNDPHLRIVIHDWQNRSDRLPPIVGEIRWLEQFALSPEALETLLDRSKVLRVSLKEGPYNDWWTGPENRIVITQGRK